MRKSKVIVTRTAGQLAKALGLTKSDAMRYLAGVPDD